MNVKETVWKGGEQAWGDTPWETGNTGRIRKRRTSSSPSGAEQIAHGPNRYAMFPCQMNRRLIDIRHRYGQFGLHRLGREKLPWQCNGAVRLRDKERAHFYAGGE